MNYFIKKWHDYLDMPKHEKAWHKQDIADEVEELEEAVGLVNRWSEYSDVAYTITRAHWSGHPDLKLPISYGCYLYGLLYMFPKYTLRYSFFRKVGKRLKSDRKITEVRNPKKVEKLATIAKNYDLDPDKFVAESKRLMKRRIFLK